MDDQEKRELQRLLTVYYDDVDEQIEAAGTGTDTTELEDLITSIDDVRTSLNK